MLSESCGVFKNGQTFDTAAPIFPTEQSHAWENSVGLGATVVSDMGEVLRVNQSVDISLCDLSRLLKGNHESWSVKIQGATAIIKVMSTSGQYLTIWSQLDKWESIQRIVSHFDQRQTGGVTSQKEQAPPTREVAASWLRYFQLEKRAEAEAYRFETRTIGPVQDSVTIWYDGLEVTTQMKTRCWEIISQVSNELRLRRQHVPKQITVVLYSPKSPDDFRSNARTVVGGAATVVNMSDRGGEDVLRHEIIHCVMGVSSNMGTANDVVEGVAVRLGQHFEGEVLSPFNQPQLLQGYDRLRGVGTQKLNVRSHTQFVDQIGINPAETPSFEFSYLVGYALLDSILSSAAFAKHQERARSLGETPFLVLHELAEMLNTPEVLAEATVTNPLDGSVRLASSKQITAALERLGFNTTEIFDRMQLLFKRWRDEQKPPQILQRDRLSAAGATTPLAQHESESQTSNSKIEQLLAKMRRLFS